MFEPCERRDPQPGVSEFAFCHRHDALLIASKVPNLEFRASVNADSGIFIRKPQLQCRDYLVAGPYKELKKYKAQDWNQIEIVVKGRVARCTCNGELLEAAFAIPDTGPIGLEGDRGQMEYRRIQIKMP